jgi:DNA-binding LacI/PurR family transcriptional regulator
MQWESDMPGSKDNRPTIRDVARAAGVSHQTVSRVLNNHPRVAVETRERVMRAMHALGYERNLAAQMLTTRRSQLIQVLTVDGKFPFEIPLLDAAAGKRENHIAPANAVSIGYSAVYAECSSQTLPRALEIAAARMVDGIFMYAPKLQIDDADLLRLCRGIPLVRRDFVLDSKAVTWVGFDQVRATQLAMQHLLDLGHRQIAVVAGTQRAINVRWRYETWRRILLEHGLELGPSAHGDYSIRKDAMETGCDGMRQILGSGKPFTAVVIANDYMALGAMYALRKVGLRIPDDVSVVSFDDAPHARFLDPPLTTVAFDLDLQKRLAFQFLFELIQHPDTEPHQHVLLPDLIVRESTRSLR